jgi:hypothetical protein
MSDEIEDVIRQEKARLKPASAHANRQRLKRLRQIEHLINRGTEQDVIDVMRSAGIRDGSPEALEILKIWRKNRSSR